MKVIIYIGIVMVIFLIRELLTTRISISNPCNDSNSFLGSKNILPVIGVSSKILLHTS